MMRFMDRAGFVLTLSLCALFISPARAAETRITILQTADIHSHFENTDSLFGLGGLARLKTKIESFRSQNPNATLLLDAGDWSEGTLFFTLRSGEPSHRVMDTIGYDAMVLGNHEWLVGATELSRAFQAAGLQTPIVSANIEMGQLSRDVPLQKYIRPHIIKWSAGKKIGIVGLSTFELVYDSFFQPVQIREPLSVARTEVDYLRNVEKCDAVIILSHMGINMDRAIALAVPGIDLIVGGHNHRLFKAPLYFNGVPITHVGAWGQYLGKMELVFPASGGRPHVENYQIHPINTMIPEDPNIRRLVDSYKNEIVSRMGPVFNDQFLYSDVYVNSHASFGDEPLGNWAVDALRETAQADVAFDHTSYSARDLYPGWSTTNDIFSIFPHVFSDFTKKAWTVMTFDVPGYSLNLMTNLLYRLGGGVKVSNAHVILDLNSPVLQVHDFSIDGVALNNFATYRIAGTQGIYKAFDFFKARWNIDLGVTNVRDTGVEAWRVIAAKLKSLSPISAAKANWQGRVRTLQPDIYIPYEQVVVWKEPDGTMKGRFEIINAGLSDTVIPEVSARLDGTPQDTLDDVWIPVGPPNVPVGRVLKAGEKFVGELILPMAGRAPGRYPLTIEAQTVPGEKLIKNNSVELFINVE